ncbi:alpha/beta hydrolase [Streptomyces venezuelae]|uniref:Alpha/beta hydrolase n=1 Tax=Streptomyces venezuelae TaxID=54571 RepID=A0A5P2BQ99_STRVZ|nr:alpha/beta hydrolase [Streptomyces venezuelae]QES32337.1 alpha/beta hydrolase [Streptomyces venezuelae]
MSATDAEQIDRANSSDRTPAVFVHGLWMLASSWDHWLPHFEAAGFAPVALTWPGEAATTTEARQRPETIAGRTVGQVADHLAGLIGTLERKPVVIGHSVGGLLTQILAGRGLSAASVAIDPAPFRGVLAMPLSTVRSLIPMIANPADRKRAKPLTYQQFRYAYANAVSEEEARSIYERYAVPAPCAPPMQAALANFNPRTEVKVDCRNPQRGPLLVVSGGKDNAIPWALASGAYKRQKRNPGVTEIVELHGRDHALTLDSRWREVADVALAFVRRFV